MFQLMRASLWALPPLAAVLLFAIGCLPLSGIIWLACGAGGAELRNHFRMRRAIALRRTAVTEAYRLGSTGQ